MDQHPVANTGRDRMLLVHDARDVDLTPNAADVDNRQHVCGVIDLHDAAWNSEAHGPFSLMWKILGLTDLIWMAAAPISRAAPMAAWPRARPPSLAGTCACESTTKFCCSSRRAPSSKRMRFWKHPPDRATVLKRGASPTSPDASLPAMVTMIFARPIWKRAAITGNGVFRARSPRIARHIANGSM